MGLRVVLESSIMQKGLPASAGSKMLENFIAPVDATVVLRLVEAGAEIVGRIDTSEFGISGLFGDKDLEVRFQDLEADVVLCNDYTGSIARAAAATGLYYLHPTYGTVSRYGLIPSVCSMDQIGIVCKSPEDGFKVLEIINGYDEKDGLMNCDYKKQDIEENKEIVFRGDTNKAGTCFTPCFPCLQVMQILCCGEFSNNINRYDGIKYGYRAKGYNGLQELYTKSRTEAFGEDVKLAAIIGAMVLYQGEEERYYDKAMKMRRIIRDSFEFDKYDVLATCCPTLSRMCGFPALTTPKNTFIAGVGCENVLKRVELEV